MRAASNRAFSEPSRRLGLHVGVPILSGIAGTLVATQAQAADLAATTARCTRSGLAQLAQFIQFQELPEGTHCQGLALHDVAVLAVLALVVIASIRFRHVTQQRKLELARTMIEQGLEPPNELLGNLAGNDLRRGVVLMFASLGIIVAALFSHNSGMGAAGLVPGFIGVGYLVSHRFARRAPRR